AGHRRADDRQHRPGRADPGGTAVEHLLVGFSTDPAGRFRRADDQHELSLDAAAGPVRTGPRGDPGFRDACAGSVDRVHVEGIGFLTLNQLDRAFRDPPRTERLRIDALGVLEDQVTAVAPLGFELPGPALEYL